MIGHITQIVSLWSDRWQRNTYPALVSKFKSGPKIGLEVFDLPFFHFDNSWEELMLYFARMSAFGLESSSSTQKLICYLYSDVQ